MALKSIKFTKTEQPENKAMNINFLDISISCELSTSQWNPQKGKTSPEMLLSSYYIYIIIHWLSSLQ